ncbi:MAG: hypothetical protein ACKOLA_05230, partial [Spartobacteria bacterium]
PAKGTIASALAAAESLPDLPDKDFDALKSLSADIQQSDGFHKALLLYWCYDQRKRQNFSEKWSSLA